MLSRNRLMFLRDSKGFPTGCLAINVDRHNHRVLYQYSVLNPADKFCRRTARRLALGGLAEAPIMVSLPRKGDLSMHEISLLVMSHLKSSHAPGRAVKSAKLWLKLNEGPAMVKAQLTIKGNSAVISAAS